MHMSKVNAQTGGLISCSLHYPKYTYASANFSAIFQQKHLPMFSNAMKLARWFHYLVIWYYHKNWHVVDIVKNSFAFSNYLSIFWYSLYATPRLPPPAGGPTTRYMDCLGFGVTKPHDTPKPTLSNPTPGQRHPHCQLPRSHYTTLETS